MQKQALLERLQVGLLMAPDSADVQFRIEQLPQSENYPLATYRLYLTATWKTPGGVQCRKVIQLAAKLYEVDDAI